MPKWVIGTLMLMLTGSLWGNWRQAAQLREREQQAHMELHSSMYDVAILFRIAVGSDDIPLLGKVSTCVHARERVAATSPLRLALKEPDRQGWERLQSFKWPLMETCNLLENMEAEDEVERGRAERAIHHISQKIYPAVGWPTADSPSEEQLLRAAAEFERRMSERHQRCAAVMTPEERALAADHPTVRYGCDLPEQ